MHITLPKIKALFENKIGINPDAFSDKLWLSAIDNRMTIKPFHSVREYAEYLFKNEAEQKELGNFLLVSETWFFRHSKSFQYLRYLVHQEWVKSQKSNLPLRILSAPCATGEEPYSIAITLLEAGVPPSWFTIDAVDINPSFIEIAREGIYTEYAFRNLNQSYKENYFTQSGNNYKIFDLVKKQVHFFLANISSPDFLAGAAPYDIIFCRNIFIYLNDQALQNFKNSLKRLLKKDGQLIVSPVEGRLVYSWGYNPVGPMDASAFRAAPQFIPTPAKATVPVKKEVATIEMAKKFADEGEFDAALEVCNRCIALDKTHSEPYFLKGVIEHARGNESEAQQYFRKALYLEPDHQEAMIYLALLAETKGNISEAEQLRRRAKKYSEAS